VREPTPRSPRSQTPRTPGRARCAWLALLLFASLAPLAARAADPARFDEAIAAFEAADAKQRPPAGAIVGTGSSSMRFWHDEIAKDLAPLTIVPRGFGGSQMSDLLHFVDRVVIAYQPRAVLLYEGDNDVADGVPAERIAAQLQEIVDKVHAKLPETRFYVLSVKPSLRRWAQWPQMQEVNRQLVALCAKDPKRLTFIDVATPMLGADGKPRPELFVQDGLHMTRAGYEIWREVVRPVLLEGEGQQESKPRS
jgi:lysophospholipase L1-like esterase